MLPIDDARWAQLSHAYGPATDTPVLLRQAMQSPRQGARNSEPWFSLWSSLCHQGDVYTASYAAIPHIVRTALEAPGPVDFSFFQLPAAVEVARLNGRGPEMPAFLAASYEEAILLLPDCVTAHRAEEWSEDMTICAAAALAVAKRHYVLAEALMNLDADLIAKINNHDWD